MNTFLESVVPEEEDIVEPMFAGLPVIYLLEGEEELGQVIFDSIPGEIPAVKIYWLQVHDEFQGKGFGKLLLKEFITRYKEYNILLDVLPTNFIALKLYKSFGFVEISSDKQLIQLKLEN